MSWFEYKGLYLGLLGATHSIYGWILLYKDKHPLYLISWFCALVALSITIEIFVYATYKNMEEKNTQLARNNKFMVGASLILQPLGLTLVTILS